MKVLVTGGCGFLGSNIAHALLLRGAEVIVLDALSRPGSESNLTWLKSAASGHQVSHFQVLVQDRESIRTIVEAHSPLDWVVHLAGQVAMTTSLSDPAKDFDTNVLGAFNILEATRRYSPDATLTYSSTNKVYGDLGHLRYSETPTRYLAVDYPAGFDESMPLDFASPYGCSKGAADQYFRDWHRSFGLRTTVFRHSSIYGGRQFSTYDQGWIGWFCAKAIEQQKRLKAHQQVEPFTIAGTGKQVRDVLHAADLIQFYLAAYEHRDATAGEVFNIGGGVSNSLSLLELFMILEDVLPLSRPLAYHKNPRRHSDQDVFIADISKATTLLGVTPQVSARDGIVSMLDWVRSCMERSPHPPFIRSVMATTSARGSTG